MFLLIDMRKAILSLGGFSPNGQPPDFSAPCQPTPTNFRGHSGHCKQAHTIKLKEKGWVLNMLFEPEFD